MNCRSIFILVLILLSSKFLLADNYNYKYQEVLPINIIEELLINVKEENKLRIFRSPDLTEEESFFTKHANSVVFIQGELSSGTGVVIDKNTILTNWHVVEGSNNFFVVFKPHTGSKPVPTQAHLAELIRCDSSKDLAILKPNWPPSEIQKVSLADRDRYNENIISKNAHVIGHPAGGFEWSYNFGVISQIRKNDNWISFEDSVHYADTIQTQTPINPGNSGGPLFLDSGNVIGLISSGCPECENIGFAIAVSSIYDFLSSNTNNCIAEQPPDPQIKYKELELIDKNNDGVPDISHLDTNGNRTTDRVYIDKDFDQDWDFILFDKDENGIYEKQIKIAKATNPDIFFYDIEQDGFYDLCAFDKNKDGQPDRMMQIESCTQSG